MIANAFQIDEQSNSNFSYSKPQSHQCEPLLPGLGRMSRGVDITSLDLFPLDLIASSGSGFRQTLFDFTCTNDPTKAKYWSTHNGGTNGGLGERYPIPDQVSSLNTVPGGAMNNKLTIHSQVDSYKQTLAALVGVDVNTGTYGDYSLSASYKRIQEGILNSNQSIADVCKSKYFFSI